LRPCASSTAGQPLTPEQTAAASAEFGKQAKFDFKALRQALDLNPGVAFAGVAREKESNDVVARTGSAAEGTAALRRVLRDALGENGWRAMLARADVLDRMAEVIIFRDDLARSRARLEQVGVDADTLRALMAGAEQGRVVQFRGAGHISALAARFEEG
jgi:CRISPR-associated endonuclease Csn1